MKAFKKRGIWHQVLCNEPSDTPDCTLGIRPAPASRAAAGRRVATSSALGLVALSVGLVHAGTALQLDDVGNLTGTTGTAQGTGATANASADRFSIAIGGGSGALAQNASVAIGDASVATGQDSVAVGRRASATGDFAAVLGSGAKAAGARSVAAGINAQAGGPSSVAIGDGAFVPTHSDAKNNIAIGTGATTGSIIPGGTSTDAGSQIAIGHGATTQVYGAIAIGDKAQALTNHNTIALGTGAVASGNSAIALGRASVASASWSVAVGDFTMATHSHGVALGMSSKTAAPIGTDGVTIAGNAYKFAGAAPSSTVSIGSEDEKRTVTNVAAGRLSGESTDAVNGSQLFATNQSIESLNTKIAASRTPYYSVNSTGGGNADNLGATGADAIASGKDASATVEGGIALGSGSVSDRAIAPSSGSIPAGSTTITYNTTDRTLLGALSLGNGTSYRQISNVADGIDAHDAVTVRQLTGALQSFAVTPTQYFHVNSTGPDSLAIGADSAAIGSQTVVLGDRGVGIGNGAVVHQDAPGGIAIGQNAASHLADAIALGTQASAGAEQGVALGAGAVVTHVGGVALGAGSVASTGAGVAGYVPPTATESQRNAIAATTSTQSAVSVGDAAHGEFRQITGVAAGTNDSDAVNVSQLKGVQSTVAALDQSSVKYDLHPDGSINHKSVTVGGSEATGPATVHNVAPGVAGTDAVNVNQLNAMGGNLNNRIDAMQNRLDGVEKTAYAGVASAMALQMPSSFVPGKTTMRLGVGTFKGQHALGVSFRRTAENNGWSLTGGVATSRAGVGATVGAEWVF